MTKLLLEPTSSAKDEDLDFAAQCASTELFELLLDRGANADAKSLTGN